MEKAIEKRKAAPALADLRGIEYKGYQTADFDRYIDFLESAGYGLADGLGPYLQHMKDEGWIDKAKKQHWYKPASLEIRMSAAKALGNIVFAMGDHSATERLAWEETKKAVKAPHSEKAVDKTKYLTWPEVQTVITQTDSPYLKYVMKFLALSGCRISEVIGKQGIRLESMRRNGEYYYISILGKGGKARTVTVNIPLIDEIQAYFQGKTWLFEHSGKPYSQVATTNRIRAAAIKALGRDHVSAHTFRHSWCTEQLRRGKALNLVSTYLGHADISTTAAIYAHNQLEAEDSEPGELK